MKREDYQIVVDTSPPDEADAAFKAWLSQHADFRTLASDEDVMVDYVLTEVDGKKTCHHRYLVSKDVLEQIRK